MTKGNIFEFIKYPELIECIEKIKKKERGIEKALDKQIVLIMQNPEIGDTIKGAPKPICGNLRKKYIMGDGGYRLFFIVYPGLKKVLGIYITTKKRKDFNYNDIDWDLLLEAHTSFTKKASH